MATLKTSSNEKTGKWKSIEGHQVLVLSVGSIGEAIEQLTDLPEIPPGRRPKVRILVDFKDEEFKAEFDQLAKLDDEWRDYMAQSGSYSARSQVKKGEGKTLVPREDGARRSPEAPPFDPRAKGLELVEKAKAAEGGAWTGEELRERFPVSAAEGGAWSGKELRARFPLSPATLHRRRKEHRIVFWRDARHIFFYPKWQFTDAGALLPGIEEVLSAFKSSDEWRIMRYFLTPRHQLGEKRPLDLLRAGEVERVVPHAHAHAAEGSW